MVFLAGPCWQLDDGRRLLEDLAATVEDEVVVGGDFSKGDR